MDKPSSVSTPPPPTQGAGSRKPIDDRLPFDFGLLEIHQQTDGSPGGPQIVETLRSVLAGEALHTFQLQHQRLSHEDVGIVLTHTVAFVNYQEGNFGGRRICFARDGARSLIPGWLVVTEDEVAHRLAVEILAAGGFEPDFA